MDNIGMDSIGIIVAAINESQFELRPEDLYLDVSFPWSSGTALAAFK